MSLSERAEGAAPLIHLNLQWFTTVMGLAGLALAWHRGAALMGPGARLVGLGVGALAMALWLALAAATLWRLRRFPAVVAMDARHAVRHPFVASIPVGLLLLVACALPMWGESPALHALWIVAAAAQWLSTAWVLGRWLHEHKDGEPPMWMGITPVLFIPVVGNVVAPLAGLPLGHAAWSMAQFGLGVFFWPVVLVLVLVRRAAHSVLPPRLLLAWFITVAPPAVMGVVSLQMQAPLVWPLGLWGVAVFCLLWAAQVLRRALSVPFHMGYWALSFPLAALTSLTLMLAASAAAAWMAAVGLASLALTSVVTGWLLVATIRGLLRGTLLLAEPVAPPLPPA